MKAVSHDRATAVRTVSSPGYTSETGGKRPAHTLGIHRHGGGQA
ncbi:hypothetical protein MICRO8M_100501 [Microbacterium sp. 8M]|nr:hypothetical protein MICRO8M_100501 [Microbacterium sp. 8M]